VDSDGLDAEIGGRAGDPDGDLAPVGDQQTLQARTSLRALANLASRAVDSDGIADIIGSAPTAS
jgi:hypothetical protein